MKKGYIKQMHLSLKSKWMLAVGVTIFISYALISIVLYVALQTWLINNEEKNALRTIDDMSTFLKHRRTLLQYRNCKIIQL